MIKKVFPVLALCVSSSALGIGIVVPFLPLYAENLGATGIWLGVIFGGFSISRAILMPVFGRLSDRRGRKLFISIGLLIYTIMSLGYIWADSVSELTLVRFIHGAAAGMIFPVAQAYIGDISPRGEEGKWMGYFNAAYFTGIGFGPLMGGVLSEHLGMTVAFSTMGGLNLLAFLVTILFLPEVSRRKLAVSSFSPFKEIGTSGMAKGLFSFQLTFSLGRAALFAFLPLFTVSKIGLNLALIGVLPAVYILLTSLPQTYSGKIADKFNRRRLVILGNFINVAALALFPFAHSFWQLLGLCALGGLGGAISMPAASALIIEEGRKFSMGSTIAITTMAMSVGLGIGPIVSGVVVDFVNITSVFYFAAAVGIVGIGLFTWFTR